MKRPFRRALVVLAVLGDSQLEAPDGRAAWVDIEERRQALVSEAGDGQPPTRKSLI